MPDADPPPAAAPAPARTATPIPQYGNGLADPRARKWVIYGALGIVSSLLLTIGVALLSNRGVASASTPLVEQVRQNRVTLVREIGGLPKSPTPGTGVTASAPSNPGVAASADAAPGSPVAMLRQLRRVGRAIVTPDGVRHLALGGAIPFFDGTKPTTTADARPSAEPSSVAFAWSTFDDDETGDAGDGIFLRAMDARGDGLLSATGLIGRSSVVEQASPVAATATPTKSPASAPSASAPTSIIASAPTLAPTNVPTAVPTATVRRGDDATPPPATATPVPATAAAVPPTATFPPTSTPVLSTATSVPPTSTPVIITATPVPATSTPVVVTATATPIVVTATPEPTRRGTRTPTPEPAQQVVVVITATPWTNYLPSLPSFPMPFQQPAPTNTPIPAPTWPPTSTLVPPTATPTPTTATQAAAPAARAIQDPPPAQAAPAVAAPRRSAPEPAQSASVPAQSASGPAPILAEAGTRTPATPTLRTAPRQPTTPTAPPALTGQAPPANQPNQPNQSGQQAAPATAATPEGPREPTVLEKLANRALIAVNTARAQAGALPLGRNAALDTASALHARYDVSTGQVEGNFQAPGSPMFVGETPSARVARAAGGSAAGLGRVGEVMALGETEPERVVQGWLDSVYHRVMLLDLAAVNGGYGQYTSLTSTSAVLDLGGQRDVANASGWFPANGATDVPVRCVCDDYAEATGKTGPFGYPVTLLLGQVRPAGLPTTARLLEGSEAGAIVAAELVDAFGNPTLVPSAPLKPSTRYVVQLSWTNGPSVSWAFVTAAQ